MNVKAVWELFKSTVREWQEDKVPLWAAALSYYTVFSIAPLLVIAIAIAGAVFGQEAAQGQMIGQIQGLVGREGAEAIQMMLQNASQPESGGAIATIFSITILFLGASGVFGQLQDALNTIWGVKPKPGQGMMSFLQSRLLSFAMVVVIGFLLLVSLILSAVLSLIGTWFGHLLPNFAPIAQFLNFVVSFSVITLLFAAIYKFLPDVKVPWSDLWIGAAFTSILFTIGKFLIGLYLGSSGVSSSYGAASSLVIILIWVFYSAQILLFGAEFTQVYAKKYGSRFVLADYAVPMNEDEFDTPENPFRVPQDQESFVQAKPCSVQTRQSNQPQLLRHAATVIGTVVAIAGMLGRSRQSKGSGRYR